MARGTLNKWLAFVLVLGAVAVTAQEVAPVALPDADQARHAYSRFVADPVHRLDATQPFLDFIRTSGAVHIVLNEALLAWMYDDFDETNKAVLYAAFLGGNMESQLSGHASGSDDVAGMRSALTAYHAIRSEQPDFKITLFERLARADTDGEFDATVERIATGTTAGP